VLGYLLSKPNDWECQNQNLINSGPSGAYVIKRVIKELSDYGYIHRERVSKGRGKIEWVTEVYESPSANPHFTKVQKSPIENTKGDFSTVESSTVDSSTVEKPHHILSTESPSTKSLNTNGRGRATDSDFQKICTLYENEIGGLSPIISDTIKDDIATYSADWITKAVALAAAGNKRNWRYIQGILKKWLAQGGPQNDRPSGNGNSPKKTTLTPEEQQALDRLLAGQ